MTASFYTPRPGTQITSFDLSGLSRLKRDAHAATAPETRKEIARQFEAVFMQMMLKRMREASPRDGLFASDQTRMVQSIADEQMAMHLADPGIGLSDALVRQMSPGESGQSLVPNSGCVPDSGPVPRPHVHSFPEGGLNLSGVKLPDVSTLLNMLALAADRPAGDPDNTNTLPGRFQSERSSQGHQDVPTPKGVAGMMTAGPSAPAHVAEFILRLRDAAHEAAEQSGVPVRLMLSQAALETGWGTHEIKFADGRPTYNVFGIKAGKSWTGNVAHVLTTEYSQGRPYRTLQAFRSYESYEAAFSDYAQLIGSHPRYRQVTAATDDVDAANAVQRAGYASDPRYAEKLIGIMGMITAGAR